MIASNGDIFAGRTDRYLLIFKPTLELDRSIKLSGNISCGIAIGDTIYCG